MKKLAAMCGLAILLLVPKMAPLMAQDQPPDQTQPPSDQTQTEPVKAKRTYFVPKYEVSGGYTYRSYYSADGTTLGMNGWYASVDYNVYRWLGIVGEFADTAKNQGIIQGVPVGDTQIYTFLAGPQIYPFAHRKLSPFGRFMYGAKYYRDAVPTFGGFPGSTITSLVRGWQLGGGIDYNVTRRVGIRLIQFDVGSSNFFPNTQNFANRSLRSVSVGIVFHFGER
ncbi:MAG TPA: hypothetical protein VMM16_10420 [Verrucomicrobiae bacterium]|nr:hypothetical protein [Verrucomicrobiae bacterium]